MELMTIVGIILTVLLIFCFTCLFNPVFWQALRNSKFLDMQDKENRHLNEEFSEKDLADPDEQKELTKDRMWGGLKCELKAVGDLPQGELKGNSDRTVSIDRNKDFVQYFFYERHSDDDSRKKARGYCATRN